LRIDEFLPTLKALTQTRISSHHLYSHSRLPEIEMALPNYPKPQPLSVSKKPITVRTCLCVTTLQLIAEIHEALKEVNDVDQVHFFHVKARILKFESERDKLIYLACPQCKKKVTKGPKGFFCLGCDRTYGTCLPTYMFQAKIADFSGKLTVTFARENGVPVLGGLSARQWQDFLENSGDSEHSDRVVSDFMDEQCVLPDFNMCLKAKHENFRGECSLKVYAVKVVPLARKFEVGWSCVHSESRDLIDRMKVYETR